MEAGERLARYQRRKIRRRKGLLAGAILAALLLAVFFITYIPSFTVSGNVLVNDERIVEAIFPSAMDQRFFYALAKDKLKRHAAIPGIASYRLLFHRDLSVEVQVQENAPVGQVVMEGVTEFFDRDGVVLSQQEGLADVPLVTGLRFEWTALYGRLKDKGGGFDTALSLLALLDNAGIAAQEISFNEALNMRVTVGEIRVELGSTAYLEEKVSELADILAANRLSGMRGTLYLDHYSATAVSPSYIFQAD